MIHLHVVVLLQPSQNGRAVVGFEHNAQLPAVGDYAQHVVRKSASNLFRYLALLHRYSSASMIFFNLRKPSSKASGRGGQPGT